jgi:hypothetical protein
MLIVAPPDRQTICAPSQRAATGAKNSGLRVQFGHVVNMEILRRPESMAGRAIRVGDVLLPVRTIVEGST